MHLRSIVLFLCLPLILAACATAQQTLSLPEQAGMNHGLLYIYRPLALRNALQTPKLLLDRQTAVAVPNGEFITLDLPAGEQRLSLQLAQQNLATAMILQIQPQQLYFVRVDSRLDFSVEHGWQRAFQLRQVNRETAMIEIQPMLQKQQKQVASEAGTATGKAQDNGSRFSIQKTQNPFAR